VGKITMWVNGTQIEAEENKSVLNAVLAAGIYIPHLCSHPDLFPQGGCKLCVVEVDGSQEPVTSCTTLAKDGMKVVTKTENLDRLRRTSMELMLAGHPHDCTGCRSYGSCELQAMMQYLSVVANPGMREIHKSTTKLNTNNPLMDREMERCIQCGRCVRVCEDVRGVHIYDYQKKGDETYIGTKGDLSLAASDCRFCGACVEVCPTGALQDKDGVFRKDVTREKALVPCTLECPAHINVPDYLRMISEGKYSEAVAIIREKVPFPHSLGYICTHFCEKGCKHKGLNTPISICALKRFAVEHDENDLWKEKSFHLASSGKKVAVIGGGPAGLTAAYYLAKKGHDVTILERNPVAGGMMAVGIPSYRLPRADLQKEVDVITDAGVKIQYNTEVQDVHKVKQEYDAVLVSVGTSAGSVIPLPGYNPAQCITALELLRAVSLGEETPLVGPGKAVTVLGGGNVAFDAVRVSLRLGATVNQACLEARENMLADKEEIEQAIEEGAIINPGKNNLCFVTDDSGKITGLKIEDVKSFRFDQGRLVVDAVPGTERVIPTDTIIFATGQKTKLTAEFGLELNKFGYPVYNQPNHSTSQDGIFVAGDVVTGTRAVINAIAGGREAAAEMDQYLGGDGNIEEHLVDVPKDQADIGKIEGFANLPRVESQLLPCEQRKCSFDKVDLSFSEEDAKAEANRCLKCPLRNQITPTKMWTAYTNR